MIERGLAGVISFASLLRNYGVRRAGQNHCAWQLLIFENPFRFPSQEVVAGHVEQKRVRPLLCAEFTIGGRNRINSGGVHDTVDSAKLPYGKVDGIGEARGLAQV